ncbi:hypothetical protein RMO93_15410 [Escherichia coli]|nr:hypothetical protein [Escherichia coli]WNK02273.1 hypothetical protein RMO93_15410 [Escherichia coli]
MKIVLVTISTDVRLYGYRLGNVIAIHFDLSILLLRKNTVFLE